MTNDLERRVREHRQQATPGFTAKYGCKALVYEATGSVRAAIEREKQIKGWVRKKKRALITAANPTWRDLAEEWPTPSELSPTDADPSLRSG